MKRMNLILGFLVVMAMLCTGCQSVPAGPSLDEQRAEAAQLVEALGTTQTQIADLKTQVATVKAIAAVATQPVVVASATDTQPAQTVNPPAAVVNTAAKVQAAAEQVQAAISKAQSIAEGLASTAAQYQTALANAKTQQDQQVAAITASVQAAQTVGKVAAPQYSPLIDLVGTLATALIAGFAVHKAGQSTQAAITTPGTTPLPAAT